MCRTAARLSLFIVNGVTLAIGVALIVVGCILIWAVPTADRMFHDQIEQFKQKSSWDEDKKKHFNDMLKISSPLGKIALVFGIITALISFAGCCGAINHMNTLLYVYIGVIGGITLGLIICVIVYFAKLKGSMSEKAVELYKNAVKRYKSVKSGDLNSTVCAFIMGALKCCGLNVDGRGFIEIDKEDSFDGKDYKDLTYPLFCCKFDKFGKVDNDCPKTFTSENSNIDHGCEDKLKSLIESYTNKAAFAVLAMIIVLNFPRKNLTVSPFLSRAKRLAPT